MYFFQIYVQIQDIFIHAQIFYMSREGNNQSIHDLKADNNEDQNNLIVKFLSNIAVNVTGQYPIRELNIKLNNEVSNDYNDQQQITKILKDYLTYPSTQLAQIHMQANRLGQFDIEENTSSVSLERKLNYNKASICVCCGLIKQEKILNTCTDLQMVNRVGISTILYFMTLRYLIILLCFMFTIYSVYSVVSNIQASNSFKQSRINFTPSYQSILVLSLGSKKLHNTQNDKNSYRIQCWLGVAVIIVWGVFFAVIKFFQRQKQKQIDHKMKTAADYSIKISNLPKNMNEDQLTESIVHYIQNAQKNGYVLPKKPSTPIKVQKINRALPYYLRKQQFVDDEIKALNKQYQKYREIFAELIKQRIGSDKFKSVTYKQIKQIEQRFDHVQRRRQQYYVNKANQIRMATKDKYKSKQSDIAFVTLSSSYISQFLIQMHEKSNYLLKNFPFNSKRHNFLYFPNTQKNARITKAPEPEDIIWINLGQSFDSWLKKTFFVYFCSIIILGASFVIHYSLSTVQVRYDKENNSSYVQYISILISIFLSVMNIVIKKFLCFLTKIQRNVTHTNHQNGVAIKGVFFSILNSILIPIIVNNFVKINLYGLNGLAYDVFILGITNSILSPLLSYFNFYYLYIKLRKKYKSIPKNKLLLNQNQLNTIYQLREFQVGYQYIYMINVYLFTCFYVSLQLIIVLFAIFGLCLTYLIQKYLIFHRHRRPIPGNNVVNTSMYQFIYAGPAVYSLGSFCWSHFFFPGQFIQITPNLVAGILSFVILILPYRKIVKKCFRFRYEDQRIYRQDIVFLASEYDRLNPQTSKQGIELYKKQLQKKYLSMKDNPQERKQFQNAMLKLIGTGNRYSQSLFPSVKNIFNQNNNSAYNSQNIILQNIYGSVSNLISPIFALKSIVPNSEVNFNMPVQNWLNTQQSQQVNSNQKYKQISQQVYNRLKTGSASALLNVPMQDNRTQTMKIRLPIKPNQQNLNLMLFNYMVNPSHSQNDNRSKSNSQMQMSYNLPVSLFGKMALDKTNQIFLYNKQSNNGSEYQNTQKMNENAHNHQNWGNPVIKGTNKKIMKREDFSNGYF